MKTRYFWAFFALIIALSGLALLLQGAAAEPAGQVSGHVLDSSGPVAGATVRWRATANETQTAEDGSFTLSSLPEGQKVEITAWSSGFYVTSTHVTPTIGGLTLTLRPYHTADNPDYQWLSPISGTTEAACGNCHPSILPQWTANAHGRAIDNPRFFSLYNGTNLSGTQPAGPGYLLDFPGTAGNCANCHAPGAAVDGYLTTDMNAHRGQITAGIHCDYCHKVGGVYLDPATASLYPNAPGVQSQRILRPPTADQIFFGPYDDIPDPDTYLPIISQSQFCAPCHQFSFWGTPIYESYEEWLNSPYAASGVTCQDCHMPPNGDDHFALPEVGGLPHPPDSIPSHAQLGVADSGLMQETVDMDLKVRQLLDQLLITVTITNTGAGHHVPTDFPGRHLILLIDATDQHGQPLNPIAGPQLPDWAGDHANRPGKAYAKILKDAATGQTPVVTYWKQTLIASDNRIPALAADTSAYTFNYPSEATAVSLTATLLFRPAFQQLADQKAWHTPDTLMEQQTTQIPLSQIYRLFYPIVYSQ